jgi:hypothetical protein
MEVNKISSNRYISEVAENKNEQVNNKNLCSEANFGKCQPENDLTINEIKGIINSAQTIGKREIEGIVDILQEDNPLLSQLTPLQVTELNSMLIDFLMNESEGKIILQDLIDLLKE